MKNFNPSTLQPAVKAGVRKLTFLIPLLIMLCGFSFQVKAQPPPNCNWTVTSEIDCDTATNFKLWLSITCAGVTTDYPLNFIPGCCNSPRTVTTNLSGSPCSVLDCATCTFQIKIQNPMGTQTYSNGQVYCCDGGLPNCIKCGCGIISISCSSRSVKFLRYCPCPQ